MPHRRHYIFVVAVTVLSAISASAQSVLVDELASFRPPYTIAPGAVAQLPDGRTFGLMNGGFNGAIYQVIPNGAGAYTTQVVYEFTESEPGAPYPFMVNGMVSPIIVGGNDGKIYYFGQTLARFDPDANTVTHLRTLTTQSPSQSPSPSHLSIGNDGHTLFGAFVNGQGFAYDLLNGDYRELASGESFFIGLFQMKDGNLIAVHNAAGMTDIVMRRLDPVTGIETGRITQPRGLAMPPAKGDDGEVYVDSNLFGDRTLQRIDTSCFCPQVLNMMPYPAAWFTSIAGVRNGKLYYNLDFNPHSLDLTVTPPVWSRLAVLQGYAYRLLPDGTLVMSPNGDNKKLYALNTNAVAADATPTPLFAEAPVNDGVDGFPSEYTQGPGGMLYGVSESSATKYGSIFRIDPDTKARALAARIEYSSDSNSYGTSQTKMVLAGDGRLYGTYNESNGRAAIFRFDPATNVAEDVKEFVPDPSTWIFGPDGGQPSRLTLGSDGWLYGGGMAGNDDTYTRGMIFKFDPLSSSYALLAEVGMPGGFYPTGEMLEATPGKWIGNYYTYDATDACSRLYSFDAATGVLSHLKNLFLEVEGCPSNYVPLVRRADGAIFGMTYWGGAPIVNNDFTTMGQGVVFRLNPDTGDMTRIHHFTTAGDMGGPLPDLTIGADGLLYAGYMKQLPGIDFDYEKGLLRVDPANGAATRLAVLDSKGYFNSTAMFLGRDGRFFGGTGHAHKAFAVAVLDAIPVTPASGPFGGTTTISATLKTVGIPMPGRTLSFTLNGHSIGSAVTNDAGIATINDASLSGLSIGTHPTAVGVSFAGDDHFPASSGSGSVTVIDVPTPGLMIGEGFVREGDTKFDFGFIVHEGATGANHGGLALEVQKKGKPKLHDRFVAVSLGSVRFSDDPSAQPGRQARPQVDTVLFSGPGKWNGKSGYRFEAFAQDLGEPGRHRESLRLTIYNSANQVVVAFDQEIDGGNIQSLRLRR